MSAGAPRPPVNSSAGNVFDVLRLVSESADPLGVAEISRRLALPASTVYRALITLEESEYISRFQNTPSYVLGPMPRLLSRSLFRRFALHREAVEPLRRLARATAETATLSVRLGWYGLRLAVVYGGRDFYHRARLGEVALLHATLASRAILATLPADEQAAYWRFVALRHPEVPGPGADLADALEQARRRGMATEPLVVSPGYAEVSVPVTDDQGRPCAALAINGPAMPVGDQVAPAVLLEARTELERAIRADPTRFRSPFHHIPADEMVIDLPATMAVAD